MFTKILIANRGEIAVRVIRACQERGVKVVAVYSDADRAALHVRFADEAYRIGPPAARESYLNIPALIEVALKSGAEAVHPGYGFLSENEEFAQAIADAGITWVGPPPAAIRAMGDKIKARRTMIEAGVPVAPGSDTMLGCDAGTGLSDTEALLAAEEMGYPVLVKASAGGGGKGMRQVDAPEDLSRALRPPAARQRVRSATTMSSSRSLSPARAMWRSRCWPTFTGVAFTWANASARSSAAIRN